MNTGSFARGALLVAISGGLLTGIAGCDNKVKECDKLIHKLNASSERVNKCNKLVNKLSASAMANALPHPGDKLESAAEKYVAAFSQGKKEIGALHFKHEKLNGFVKDYVGVATQAEASARTMEALLETLVEEGKDAKQQQKVWADALDALKKQCDKQSADCIAVEKVLSTPPPTTGSKDPKKVAARLEAQSAALDSLTLEDKNVSRVVASYSAALKANVKVLEASGATQDRLDKLSKRQDAYDRKTDALMAKVNGYCHK